MGTVSLGTGRTLVTVTDPQLVRVRVIAELPAQHHQHHLGEVEPEEVHQTEVRRLGEDEDVDLGPGLGQDRGVVMGGGVEVGHGVDPGQLTDRLVIAGKARYVRLLATGVNIMFRIF